MRKNLLVFILGVVIASSYTFVSHGQTNLLLNGNCEAQGAWIYNDWNPTKAGEIAPTDVDFGFNSNVPHFGVGKCFHSDGTVDGSWHEIKEVLWQPVLLHKGKVYRVEGAFKDNSANSVPFTSGNSCGIWAEIHFYYKAPVADSMPAPSQYLYAFNSWDNSNANGMDGTFQDSVPDPVLIPGKGYQLSAKPGHPYYYVPDSIFATGKDTVTTYFAIQFGMANGYTEALSYDFTMDEVSVIDSAELSSGILQVNNNDKPFDLYPNLSDGQVKLTSKTATPAYYRIYSVLGAVVKEGRFMKSEILDLNSLKKGIYIVKLEGEGKSYTSKLILK